MFSYQQKHLVLTSQLLFSDPLTTGLMWNLDGTLCTLHHKGGYYVANSRHHRFPEGCQVTQIGQSHLFASPPEYRSPFTVYHTETAMASPSLSVPCTWASPSIQQPSGLILSTTHRCGADDEATCAPTITS
ncbi:hypothetical protein Pelo_2621 [Pelomyxa schiedti]|nr:hypothetical protein Pelo_2621 [Pelomyxa schiedti]